MRIQKDNKKKSNENVITIQEDVKLPGTKIILEKGDKIRVMNETGEWVGDEDQMAWVDYLRDILLELETFSRDIKFIKGSIKGFDNYQGPYGYISYKGRKYKVWTTDEYEYGPKAIFIEDFPIENSPGLDGFVGSIYELEDLI